MPTKEDLKLQIEKDKEKEKLLNAGKSRVLFPLINRKKTQEKEKKRPK